MLLGEGLAARAIHMAVKPVEIPSPPFAFVSGWGQTSDASANLPITLQWVLVDRITKEACNHTLISSGLQSRIDNSIICTYWEPENNPRGAYVVSRLYLIPILFSIYFIL